MHLQYECSDALTVSPHNWYDTYNITDLLPEQSANDSN